MRVIPCFSNENASDLLSKKRLFSIFWSCEEKKICQEIGRFQNLLIIYGK